MKYMHTRRACVSYVENRKLYIINVVCTALLDACRKLKVVPSLKAVLSDERLLTVMYSNLDRRVLHVYLTLRSTSGSICLYCLPLLQVAHDLCHCLTTCCSTSR